MRKVILGKNRIEAISDGIYAIAMTLAVLSIDVTSIVPTHESLVQALPGMANELRHYVISFLILASFWKSQHYLLDRIRQTDTGLNSIIMIHLLFITLIPVTTDIIGNIESVLAIQIFAVNLFLISMSIVIENAYTRSHPHLGLHTDLRKYRWQRAMIFPGLSVLVFFLAWPLKDWATMIYLLIPLIRRAAD